MRKNRNAAGAEAGRLTAVRCKLKHVYVGQVNINEHTFFRFSFVKKEGSVETIYQFPSNSHIAQFCLRPSLNSTGIKTAWGCSWTKYE